MLRGDVVSNIETLQAINDDLEFLRSLLDRTLSISQELSEASERLTILLEQHAEPSVGGDDE